MNIEKARLAGSRLAILHAAGSVAVVKLRSGKNAQPPPISWDELERVIRNAFVAGYVCGAVGEAA
jgi:hypothetical protein